MIEILLTIIGLNFFYSLPFFLSLVLNERQYWFVGLALYRCVCVCWICCCRQYYCFSPLSFLFIFAHSLIAQYLFEFPLCNIFLYSFVKRSCLRLCAAIAFWLCPYASACISFFFSHHILFICFVCRVWVYVCVRVAEKSSCKHIWRVRHSVEFSSYYRCHCYMNGWYRKHDIIFHQNEINILQGMPIVSIVCVCSQPIYSENEPLLMLPFTNPTNRKMWFVGLVNWWLVTVVSVTFEYERYDILQYYS